MLQFLAIQPLLDVVAPRPGRVLRAQHPIRRRNRTLLHATGLAIGTLLLAAAPAAAGCNSGNVAMGSLLTTADCQAKATGTNRRADEAAGLRGIQFNGRPDGGGEIGCIAAADGDAVLSESCCINTCRCRVESKRKGSRTNAGRSDRRQQLGLW
jgi:hypothetical protein